MTLILTSERSKIDLFCDYEPIGKCFISIDQTTGEQKHFGILEIVDDIKYKMIVAKKWHDVNGVVLETTRYKSKNINPSMFQFQNQSQGRLSRGTVSRRLPDR